MGNPNNLSAHINRLRFIFHSWQRENPNCEPFVFIKVFKMQTEKKLLAEQVAKYHEKKYKEALKSLYQDPLDEKFTNTFTVALKQNLVEEEAPSRVKYRRPKKRIRELDRIYIQQEKEYIPNVENIYSVLEIEDEITPEVFLTKVIVPETSTMDYVNTKIIYRPLTFDQILSEHMSLVHDTEEQSVEDLIKAPVDTYDLPDFPVPKRKISSQLASSPFVGNDYDVKVELQSSEMLANINKASGSVEEPSFNDSRWFREFKRELTWKIIGDVRERISKIIDPLDYECNHHLMGDMDDDLCSDSEMGSDEIEDSYY